MTKFELLSHRIESLQRKADEAGTDYIKSIWTRHLHDLQAQRRAMTIDEASQEVWP